MALIEFKGEKIFEEDNLSMSLLDISLKHGIHHMHVCGGTARCSTCRVIVLENPQNVLPRNELEKSLATKKGLEDNIRLACQTHITGPVTVRRLTLDDCDADMAVSNPQETTGREAKLAVLFSDIRDFTVFSETRLPYDTIHILNRYFYQMGNAILEYDGYIDKYIGDGIMAIFGLKCDDPVQNCFNATAAALEMLTELEDLNLYLKRNFQIEFKTGIGIHFGEAVVGELGHPERRQITVIGDTVNMASRIESSTKEFGVPLLVSESVREQLQGYVEIGRVVDAKLKGKSGTYKLHEVEWLNEKQFSTNSIEEMHRRLRRTMLHKITLQKAPLMLRLAFHDAGSYVAKTGKGGANGSVRLPEELAREENKGLDIAIETLRPFKEHYPSVSWADLIAISGALAVERTGGPQIDIPMGRKDSENIADEGMVPTRNIDGVGLRSRFDAMGFSVGEMVVLSGAHTIGRQQGSPFTNDWYRFSNSYFKAVLKSAEQPGSLLMTDMGLAKCPECRAFVERYANDEGAFFSDFATAYRKMTLLGTGIGNPTTSPIKIPIRGMTRFMRRPG